MEVRDLMLGDWVNVNGLNLKVGAIHADEIGVFDPDHKIYWCSDDGLDRIDPIPLTEEILVKNGFKGNSLDGYYYWQDADRIELDGNFGYHGIVINYVHQLQHLLRLYGIEKEIEL